MRDEKKFNIAVEVMTQDPQKARDYLSSWPLEIEPTEFKGIEIQDWPDDVVCDLAGQLARWFRKTFFLH